MVRRSVANTRKAPNLRLGCARLPRDVNLLGESDGRIVVGELAVGSAVGAAERNAVVDVQDTGGSARRPDYGSGLDLVLLGVDLAVGEGTATSHGHACSRGLSGILREEVARHEVPFDTLVEACPSVVGSGDDGVLEAAGVLEVQVKLAGAGVVLLADVGTNVGLELVETVGDDLG